MPAGRSRRAGVALLVLLGLLGPGAGGARAHPLLLTAAPAPGSVLPSPPSRLTLAFSEAAVPQGSSVTLSGPGGRVSSARLAPSAGGRELSLALRRRLAPGVYRVRWVALGQDGHTVDGRFAFGVEGPGGVAPAGASALSAFGDGRGGAAPGEGLPTLALRWLGLIAASLLWGGPLVLHFARARLAAERRVLGLVALAALASALDAALAEPGGLALITASGTGIALLARLVLAVFGSALLWLVSARRRPVVAAGLGLGLLLTYGLSGHVLSQGTPWATAVMAVHVVAAGAWLGGLLAVVGLALSGRRTPRGAARAFAPLAVAGLGLAALTGAITAVREVGHLYFLWWSPYGRVVIAKVALVIGAGALALVASRGARRWLLALDGVVALALIALAGTLSGLEQGRGQPLPAQRGDLLPGPALASAVLPSGTAPVVLAPARAGTDRIMVTPPAPARHVLVRLVCGCDVRPVISELTRVPGGHGTFAAEVPLPTPGTWNGYVSVDGRASAAPVSLPVGVQGAPGAPVREIFSPADLSGPGAARCRAYLTGLELATARLNQAGGVDGGAKVAVYARDDAGRPLDVAPAAGTIAVAPCGSGAEDEARRAAIAGVPVLSGDPATGVIPAPHVFRLAADPYADGLAMAQALASVVVPQAPASARRLLVVAVSDGQGRRRLEGIRAGLAALHRPLDVSLIPEAAISGRGRAALERLLDRRRTLALLLDATDAQTPLLAASLRRLPAGSPRFGPAPLIVAERVLSESFVLGAGGSGRLGLIQGTTSVTVDSRDGLILSHALPSLFGGERASLEALRGYVAGLALDYGMARGTGATAMAERLARPLPFTDAVPEPWRSDAPAAGVQQLGLLEPTFLSANLIPTAQGGESYTGEYFPDGAWMRPTAQALGPSLQTAVPALR